MHTPRRSLVEWRLRNAAGEHISFRVHPGQSLSIGRDLAADIPVLDGGVSRHHALLELDGDDLWLEDLHAHGGTRVNGELVRRTRVESGDILTFGGVSFTLTASLPAEVESDPCRRLSRERLLALIRLSREIRTGGERGLLFGTIVEAAVAELRAERGIILLRDPGRHTFLPAAAHPASLLESALRILPPGAAERLSLGPGARAIAPGGLGAPLGCGGKPDGIIFLEHGPGRSFDPEDEEMLSAIAWVASPAVEAAARLEAMRAWNSRLEGALASRGREGPRRGTALTHEEAGAPVLRLAEAHLSRESASLDGVEDGAASAALEDAAVLLAAARRLLERKSARAEEVQVGHALAQAFDDGPAGESALSDVHGGDLTVLCAPDELADALRLARSLLGPPESREGARYRASARVTGDGHHIEVRLSASGEGPSEGRLEAMQVLRRLVAERLGGGAEWSADGELELSIANRAPEMRETRLIGELARRGTASP